MTDKVQKIREEVARRVKFHAESSDPLASAYVSEDNAIIFFIDSLQEEPVSEDLEEAAIEICSEILKGETIIIDGYECVVLSDAAECFKAGAQWQKRKDSTSISEELEEASKEWLRPQLDKSYAAYGETKQMELTHFDGYAMLDAIEFGAKWQKEYMMKEIKSRLVDAATNQDNSTAVAEQTYYNGMVDALGRLRDKFMED